MVNINFNLRDKGAKKSTPINIVVRWNNQRLILSSGLNIFPKQWHFDKQAAKSSSAGSADMNKILIGKKEQIEKAYLTIVKKLKRDPSNEELREEIEASITNDAAAPQVYFLEFVLEFIEGAENRINAKNGKAIAHTTKKKYYSTYTHLKDHLKSRNQPTLLTDIDQKFYDRFNTYLTKTKKLAVNSVGKYIQTLKTFLRAAEEQGLEVNPAYKSSKFIVPKEETTAVYLSYEELDELFALDLSKRPALERARDLLVFHANTGLRHSDWKTFSEIEFHDERILIRTQKTSQVVPIPLHPTGKIIRAKYEGIYPNALPPALSNQKMNAYLKELAELSPALRSPVIIYKTVGGIPTVITKKKYQCITTHTARRSFCTNLYRAGCPIRSIMEITGHKTESSFRSYIRLNGEEHAKIVEMYMEKAAPLAIVK